MTTNNEESSKNLSETGEAAKAKDGKSSVQAYGAESRTNLLMFDPEKLVIVEDPKHPLYDERCKLPIDDTMICNIMFHGVLEPVIVTKNTETGETEVVDGRQRVRNAREANKRLKKRGEPAVLVPAVVRRGDGAALGGVMISTNEIRKEDTPMNRAKKMQRMLDLGHTEESLTTIFGCGKQTIKNTLALLECCADVRKAVETGKINVSTVFGYAKLEPAEQKARLEEMLTAAEGETTPKAKRRKIRQVAKSQKTGPQMRGKKEVVAYFKKVDESEKSLFRDVALAVLEYVLGRAKEPKTGKKAA